MRTVFKIWIPIAIGITALLGVLYIVVQQTYRLNADDPQIQLAEDTAANISNSTDAITFGNAPVIDLAKSLAPFVIVYDQNGTSIASTGALNGSTPTPPSGVFDAATGFGENRLTWQPQQGVRIAAVIKPYNGTRQGFVLAGRSLLEVERRINTLGIMIALGWLGSLVATLFTTIAVVWLARPQPIAEPEA